MKRLLVALAILAICSTAHAAQQTFNDGEANSSVRSKINANAGEVTNIQTLSGVAAGSVNLGAFTGLLLSDTLTIKAALQAVETAIELYPATCTNDEDTVEWDTTTSKFVCRTLPTLDVDTDLDGLVDKLDLASAGLVKSSAAGAISIATPGTDYPGLTAGNTFTGENDFGGATSLEVPNGSGPTVDAAGEIAVDTTSDQLILYGAAKRVISYKDSEKFVVKSPVDADDFLIGPFEQAVTITNVKLVAVGGGSIAITPQICGTDTTTCSSLEAITADGGVDADDGSLSYSAVVAGGFIKILSAAPTGTVNFLSGSIYYTITAD